MTTRKIAFFKKFSFSGLAGLFLLAFSYVSHADVLVLVHGYMGSPSSWEYSRVNELLEEAGWQRGGMIIPETKAFYPDPMQKMPLQEAKNISFVVDMPWMRPIEEQADYLNTAMEIVSEMRPEEPITLIGHSAGALAARMWLVENQPSEVVRLISIAAPNLGTVRAYDALDLTDPVFPPLDAVRNMFGGKLYNTVRRSRALVHDFTPPSKRNPTVLYWLNQQPHPDIDYISIVREDRRGIDRDWLVSADSQDLNSVPALRGKASSYTVSQKHPLNPEDGYLIVSLLSKEKR